MLHVCMGAFPSDFLPAPSDRTEATIVHGNGPRRNQSGAHMRLRTMLKAEE